jgi:hypothetical protein
VSYPPRRMQTAHMRQRQIPHTRQSAAGFPSAGLPSCVRASRAGPSDVRVNGMTAGRKEGTVASGEWLVARKTEDAGLPFLRQGEKYPALR